MFKYSIPPTDAVQIKDKKYPKGKNEIWRKFPKDTSHMTHNKETNLPPSSEPVRQQIQRKTTENQLFKHPHALQL